MKKIDLKDVEAGMKLEKNIVYKAPNDSSMLLAVSGTVLSEKLIRKLNLFNIRYIYVSSIKNFEIPNKEAYNLYSDGITLINSIFNSCSTGEIDLSITSLLSYSNDLIEFIKTNTDAFLSITGLKDPENYVAYHSLDVAIYSIMLGIQMKLSQMDLLFLAIGSLIHDVGMSKLPKEILLKPGKPTDEEFECIRSHVKISSEIMRKYPDLGMLVPNIINQHHERWDGSGYPNGLKAVAINQLARIVTIADVYDALTSERIYRHAQLPSIAAEYILGKSYFDFDPTAASIFATKVISYPLDSKLLLSTGEIGRVVELNPENNFRPKMEIFSHEDNICINEPYIIDLFQRLDITITSVID